MNHTTRMKLALAGFAVLALLGQNAALAHEGPPFPILMDKPLAGYMISVWADPDIGDAQFYIIVEAPEGGPPAVVPEVQMWTQPVSGRLERVHYKAERQAMRNLVQFEARPYFDQRDFWTVGFQVTPPGGEMQELTAEVESTPPGYGQVDFAIYLFPFVFLGGFWVLAMIRRSRLRQEMLLRETAPAAVAEDSERERSDIQKDETP